MEPSRGLRLLKFLRQNKEGDSAAEERMSGDERNPDRHLPHGSPTPRSHQTGPDQPGPRFLGTADADPVAPAGRPPANPVEALGRLVHPEGKPLRMELPTDPLALSPAAIEALAGIVDMLGDATGEKKAGHEGPAKSNREVEDDER
jgi:hypothetical protein